RQSRDNCVCGRVLQNQHHERVTRVDAALKTNSSALTTGEDSRLRPRHSTKNASPFSTTLHLTTTWTPLPELRRSPYRTSPQHSRPWKAPLYPASLALKHVHILRLHNGCVTLALGFRRAMV